MLELVKAKIDKFIELSLENNEVINGPIVVVHNDIKSVMDYITKDPRLGNEEYGFYLQSETFEYKGHLCVFVNEKFQLPKQEVTTASITFLEGRDSDAFNAVIHRHPEGVNEFSSIDDTSINANFSVSLLYMRSKGIFRAHVNTKLLGKRLGLRTGNIIYL